MADRIDSRSGVRREVSFAARFRADEYRVVVSVSDVSEGGCRVHTGRLFLEEGSTVSLRIEGFESFFASVRWWRRGEAGLAFERPLHPAIVDHLHRENPRPVELTLDAAA